MGASGAGKTSLLNILSDRISTGSILKPVTLEGDKLFNDTMKCDQDNFGKLSGYVMQDDILY